ncbi:MAG: hypothetical protein QM713_06420 [Arachnia sp.]
MRAIILAELKAAWSSWAAVLLAFVAASFAVLVSLIGVDAVEQTVALGVVDEEAVMSLRFLPIWNLLLSLLAGLSVIAAVTGLVVQARRGSLARLSLAGATPGQVSRILLAQLAVVALLGAFVGAVLALVSVRPILATELRDRAIEPQLASDIAAQVHPNVAWAALGAVGFVAWAVLSGMGQSRVAAALSPVEALRTVPGATVRRRRIGRWVGAVLLALLVAGLGTAAVLMAPELGVDGSSAVLQMSVICMLLTGSVLSLSAPLTVGLLTRVWTALIPSRSAPWVLARAGVIAKGERLARTVTPVMFAIGILVGLGALAASTNAFLESVGREGLDQAGVTSLLLLVALVLLISTGGGVSVVLMMSRQREGELALIGVTGGTSAQQVMVVVFEGAIITVTAVLLGCVMSAVGVGIFAAGLGALGMAAPVIVPWGVLGAVALVFAVITIASTTLPVLPSLGRSARTVVAQLAAE